MIWLHIGPHKTATTYIQRCFKKVARELGSSGFVYPKLGTNLKKRHMSHFFLGRFWQDYLKPDGKHHEALLALGATLRESNKDLLVSSESLCRWPAERFVQLADLLGQEQIEICYVIRDPFDVFVSFWAEQIKQGHTTDFRQSFSESFEGPKPSRVVDPVIDVLPLASHERINVSLLVYDQIRANKQDIFSVILNQWLGITDIRTPKLKRFNERLPLQKTEFIRLLTKRGSGGERRAGSDVRRKVMKKTNFFRWHGIVKSISKYGEPCLQVMTVPRTTGFVPQSEERIRKELGPHIKSGIPSGPLFPRHDAVLSYYKGECLERIPQIEKLLDNTERRLGLHTDNRTKMDAN